MTSPADRLARGLTSGDEIAMAQPQPTLTADDVNALIRGAFPLMTDKGPRVTEVAPGASGFCARTKTACCVRAASFPAPT